MSAEEPITIDDEDDGIGGMGDGPGADFLTDQEFDDYLLACQLEQEQKEKQTDTVDMDKELAVQLQKQFSEESNGREMQAIVRPVTKPMAISLVDPSYELSDPNPNIWQLFRDFDSMFFNKVLTSHSVEVSWGNRLTLCAGLCSWNRGNHFCSIRLSKPLLQLRPRKDLVETLLHEMIHGYLFVKGTDDNHESHGQHFHMHMHRINQLSGTKITVYHNFHDEVTHYQKHVWRCTGPCRERRPFFGYLRRSMNRAPGPNDPWWNSHTVSCTGTFEKISEPKPKEELKSKGTSGSKAKKLPPTPKQLKNKDIRIFVETPKAKTASATSSSLETAPFSGMGHKLGSR